VGRCLAIAAGASHIIPLTSCFTNAEQCIVFVCPFKHVSCQACNQRTQSEECLLAAYSKHWPAHVQVAALGFVSVFDQIMEGLPAEEQKAVLEAFAGALNEDSAQYRRDAEELEAAAKDTKGA